MRDSGSMELKPLEDFASDLIQRAGDQALGFYGKGKPRIKFDEGLVTEAELSLNQLFLNELQGRFPGHKVFQVSELQKEYSHEGRRYLWIYDTIDGVANFQAGIPIWGLSLALLENFWPIFGFFYMPATGDLFHARAGGKALWGDKEMLISPLHEINDESRLFTYSRFHHHYRSSFPGKILNLGCTGAHVCYVARGRAEAALIANESYRGLAAVSVIVEAAGGKILKMDGQPVSLNEYLESQRVDGHLLVSAPKAFDEIRQHLKGIS
jgi:myo-inositol-1(or 4)-monophosphatase